MRQEKTLPPVTTPPTAETSRSVRSMPSIAAVIFDMDGVLVHSEPVNFEALRRLLASHGVRYTETDNDEFVGVTDREHFGALKERYGLAPSVDDLCRRWLDLVLDLIRDHTEPELGVPDVLRTLAARGFRLALASSAVPAVILARLTVLGIIDAFQVIVSAADVECGKPAPDVFLTAASRLSVPAERCLVVEDSRNGLLAARRADMMCAVVPTPTTRHQGFEEADVRLGGLPELLRLAALQGSDRAGTE
jgi:HAD superfamily hydrolase (TIGR01509 family)